MGLSHFQSLKNFSQAIRFFCPLLLFCSGTLAASTNHPTTSPQPPGYSEYTGCAFTLSSEFTPQDAGEAAAEQQTFRASVGGSGQGWRSTHSWLMAFCEITALAEKYGIMSGPQRLQVPAGDTVLSPARVPRVIGSAQGARPRIVTATLLRHRGSCRTPARGTGACS